MTFSEKLDRAKIGSRAAYESLCLTCIDSLYAAALIALKNESSARTAVINAINDGYAGIARIKDEKHLRSWLVHELTKNIVDMLKEFKAGGIVNQAAGEFAETERLPDVERLIFSVAAAFDYGTREISVLTGMPEASVSDKLFSAKAHLGAYYEEISSAAKSCSAPENLRERYRTFDESLARLEATSAYPVTGLDDGISEDEDAEDAEEVREEEVPEEVTAAEEPEETAETTPEEAAGETEEPAEEPEAVISGEVPEDNDEDNVFADESEVSEAVPDEESQVEDFPEDGDESDSPLPLNAETFIAVVSAEKMKGSEFLRLIGNTRISNSVYREIEQNPRLTKKQLIQLLEESPLTENDYYKLLTAVKHRREVLTAKEELQAVHERAGLFSGAPKDRPPRRRKREEHKTELQLAIEMDLPKKDAPPLTINEQEKNDSRVRIPERHERHHHSADKKPKDDLSSLVSEYTQKEPERNPEPFHPAEMSGIFNSIRELEAVDPFAAIYANEIGEQAKPGKLKDQRVEWNRKADEQRASEPEPVPTDGTQEFRVEPPAPPETSDTQQLSIPYPKVGDRNMRLTFDGDEVSEPEPEPSELPAAEPEAEEIPEPEPPEEPAPAPAKPSVYFPEEDEEPEIITHKPAEGISLTQIIGEYAGIAPKDGAMTVDEAIGEEDEFGGFTPSVPTVPDDDEEEDEPQETAPVIPEPEPEPEPELEPKAPAEPEEPTAEIPEPEYAPYTPEESPAEKAEPYDPTVPEIKEDPRAKAAETPITGFTAPLHITVPGDEPDDGEDEEPDDEREEPDEKPAKPAKKPERRREKPAPEPEDEEPDEEPDEPEESGESNAAAPERERYKGNEYFVDDDEYVEGINNGKMIFCAVCAVLLLAGAVVMKFVLPKADGGTVPAVSQSDDAGAVTDAPAQAPVSFDSKDILTNLSSYDEIAEAGTPLFYAPQSAQYLRASAEPYDSFLSESWFTTSAAAYIYNAGTIRVVSLDPAAPVDLGTVALNTPENASFIGFTVIDGTIYAVSQTKDTVYAEIIGGNYTASEMWSVTGSFVEMGILGGKPVIVTRAPVNGTDVPHSSTAASPAPEDIVKLGGAEFAGFTVISEAGGSGILDILGGCAAYAKFDEDKLTILAEDNNTTFAVDITPELTAEDPRRFAGAAFSADCLNGDSFIGSNEVKTALSGSRTYSGVAAVKGSNAVGTGIDGERPYAVAWQDENTACVFALRSDGAVVLYGFDMSGETPVAAQVTESSVYQDKLISAGDRLAGLKAEAAADGERIGLKLSEYTYSGKLTETSSAQIGLGSGAPEENLKYLSSPAENDPAYIAVSEDSKIIAVPTVYFDGFSEVKRIVTFSAGASLKETGELMLYDVKSDYFCTAIRQGTLFIITEGKVMTANASDCSDIRTVESVSAAPAQ